MSKAYDHLVTRINFARVAFKAPAIMAVIIRHHGSYAVSAVRGVRRADLAETAAGNRVQDADKFPTASCTKPMTGYLAGVLLKITQYHWDSTIEDFFPEFRSASARKHFGMRDDFLKVTVRQLMSHTSRLAYAPSRGSHAAYGGVIGAMDASLQEEYCSRKAEMRRRYNYVVAAQQDAPGAVGVYGGGSIVVAAALERITGKSYQELMREYVFDPLGMKDAGVGRTATSASTPDGIWEHSFDFNALTFVPSLVMTDRAKSFESHNPAGGVRLNAADASRFLAAQMSKFSGARPLKGAWLEETFPEFANNYSGSGWRSRRPIDPDMAISHNGDDGGCRTLFKVWPFRGEGFAIFTNGGGEADFDGDPKFNIGKKIVGAVAGEIDEMLTGWNTLFPGE